MRRKTVQEKEVGQYIVILDYNCGSIWYKKIPAHFTPTEEWFKEYGLNMDEISYMLVQGEPSFELLS